MSEFFANGTVGESKLRNNTAVVGAVLIVLSFFGAIVYLTSTDRPIEVAVGFMLPIVSTVVGVVFVAGKVDQVGDNAQKAVHQTNGLLDAKIQKAIQSALDAHDQGKGAEDVGTSEEAVHGTEDGGQ